jgi:hypothetical protein
MYITSNLEAALQQLRLVDEPRVLWIDAICINQDDVHERSRQVWIMQEIYAKARQVIVWLGPEREDDNRAFASLESLRSQLDGQENSWFLVGLGWWRARSGKIFSGGAHRSMVSDVEYEHLTTLLRRDWFRRTWVIQEVASSQSAVFLCGRQCMSWEVLANVYMRLGDYFLPVSQMGGKDAHHSLENITAIERLRRSNSGPLSMSLFHILLATSFSKCQDQRDKIFAVMGLAKDWVEKGVLIPDYSIKQEDVLKTFIDFAVIDSNHHKSLRTLSCPSGPSVASKLPSWVPDWRTIGNVHPFTRYSDRTKFCASGGMPPEAWHSDNKTVLHVTGVHIDTISKLGSDPTFTKAVAVFEITTAKIVAIVRSFSWLQECRDMSRDTDGVLSAKRSNELWRTLTCGLTGDGFPVRDRYSDYFSKYMDFMLNAPERFAGYLIDAETSPDEVRGLDEASASFETHAHIEAALDKWSSKRRFSVTYAGRLACVPLGSRRGDIICILFGGEVPYVLRPIGDGYFAIVGECYVDDIMHGEGLSLDVASREFRLR